MKSLSRHKSFIKDLRNVRLTDSQATKLFLYVAKLLTDESLPPEAKDHALQGEWGDFRELHLRNGGEIIGLAAAGTGITFFSLAAIGSTPARDFSGLGKFLFVGLILALVASLANMFFHFDPAHLMISSISVLIFSGYILYDVNQIVRGGQTNYVMATLSLYLDIYNLFVNLLSILMALMGNDRD